MSKLIINRDTLVDIADAVRGKSGESAPIRVDGLATAISNLPSGVEFPTIDLTLGTQYMKDPIYTWWLNNAPANKLVSGRSVMSLQKLFENNRDIVDLSKFNITFTNTPMWGEYGTLNNIFNGCVKLENVPGLDGTVWYAEYLFGDCNRLRYINNNKMNITFHKGDNNGALKVKGMFTGCWSLREIPNFYFELNNIPTITWNDQGPYSSLFNQCYSLDEIKNIPVISNGNASYTSNPTFNSNTFFGCMRAEHITFSTNEGSVKQWNLSNQTIDLSYYVGYAGSSLTDYNNGLTNATRITDDASYEALKNNPDSWTTLADYSRYNLTSAVETLHSLPSNPSGGTNTIKFKADQGAKTDGGRIGDMTQAEIELA